MHGHESKCAHLHGHNYKFEFHCTAGSLDNVGRVIDFSDIKEKLCYCALDYDADMKLAAESSENEKVFFV